MLIKKKKTLICFLRSSSHLIISLVLFFLISLLSCYKRFLCYLFNLSLLCCVCVDYFWCFLILFLILLLLCRFLSSSIPPFLHSIRPWHRYFYFYFSVFVIFFILICVYKCKTNIFVVGMCSQQIQIWHFKLEPHAIFLDIL